MACFVASEGSATSGSINLINKTTRKSTSFNVSALSGTHLLGNCAEWIVERPELPSGLFSSLANYGTVTFKNAAAYTRNQKVVQASAGNNINMIDGSGNTISIGTVSVPDIVTCVFSGINTPLIAWSDPNVIIHGIPLSDRQLNASAFDPVSGAAVPGTFIYSPAPGTVLDIGTHTLYTAFTPNDTTKYTTASGNVVILVEYVG